MSAAAPTSRSYPGLRLLLFLAAAALGWNVDGYRLLDPDEGRNAEVAREMAHSNDYLVPHLDGLPYLDKPIVYFAAAAALMELLGPTETAARLPAYAATLATIGLLVGFARRRWGPDAGWLTGIAWVRAARAGVGLCARACHARACGTRSTGRGHARGSRGHTLRANLAVLRRFTKYEPVDAVAVRRQIAGRLLDAERYVV